MIPTDLLDTPAKTIALVSVDAALATVAPVAAGRRDARARIGSAVASADPPSIKIKNTLYPLLPDPRFPENTLAGDHIRAVVTATPSILEQSS